MLEYAVELRSIITRTDVHISSLVGEVIDHGDCLQGRDPVNPGYYHGNYLVIPGPPTAASLPGWTARARALFADDPRIRHVCLVWDEGELAPEDRAAALGQDFLLDHGVGMVMTAPADITHDLEVRPLDPESDWDAIAELNRRGDASEDAEDTDYALFKQRIREGWRVMMRAGAATWWGAFRGGELIGQCGMVRLGDVGRFQSVEVAPAHRGQGVCSAMVTEVARRAFASGATRVALQADPTGPALRLYERLGFVAVSRHQSMVLGGGALRVREEREADWPDVRALLRAAFEQPGEGALVGALRGEAGVIALVAERAGTVLGHILFSPVAVEGPDGEWSAIGLGPMGVRPEFQGQGIGGALVEAGLAACREAGHDVCVVLGHPEYYPRFGFAPAPPLGVRCKWPVPDEVFMVAELSPRGLDGRTGLVRYHAAFDAV